VRPIRSSINEAPRPKPFGSLGVDAAGNEKFSLSFQNKKKIGTWNVRSLYEGKMNVVLQEMKRNNIDSWPE